MERLPLVYLSFMDQRQLKTQDMSLEQISGMSEISGMSLIKIKPPPLAHTYIVVCSEDNY